MDRLLYVAMSGARQLLHAQNLVANNLANANTTGFRVDRLSMEALPVYGPGQPARVYVQARGTGPDTKAGAFVPTGRELDVAVSGAGYIAVQGPDGREGYTRAGNLQLSANGQLTTGQGWPVLGNGGPIAIPPTEKIEIGADGTISAVSVGQDAATLSVLDRIKLVAPDERALTKTAQGLLRLSNGAEAAPDAEVTLVSGQLESSNVNAIEQMTAMIDYARQYEMQIKMMSTARDNADRSAALMQLG
ncbi:MAG: flagellar basal-body rod protein FlgF [Porticoccaceae bacterium]